MTPYRCQLPHLNNQVATCVRLIELFEVDSYSKGSLHQAATPVMSEGDRAAKAARARALVRENPTSSSIDLNTIL